MDGIGKAPVGVDNIGARTNDGVARTYRLGPLPPRRRGVWAATIAAVVVVTGVYVGSSASVSAIPVAPVAASPITLDASAQKVPDSDFSAPSNAIHMATTGSDSNSGSAASPVRTLTRAIALVPSGGTIVVAAGTYRDWYSTNGTSYSIAGKALTLQAAPHAQVWFDGTDVIAASRWTDAGSGKWSMAWSTPDFCSGAYYSYSLSAQRTDNLGPCAHKDMSLDPVNLRANDPQMVYANGVREHEATSLAAATGGAFYYDWSARRMYISTNPATTTIELASRPVALVDGAGNTKILGIGFKRYATNEYSNVTDGAIYLSNAGNLIEDSAFREMAGQAASVDGQGAQVIGTVFANNGFNGLGSNGHEHSSGVHDGLVIADSVFNNNNTEHFGTGCSLSCAQAGVKIAHMDGFTVRDNIFENNYGQGFWCDEACTGGIMVDNYAINNQKSGLFYEISSGGIIASNLVVGGGDGGGIRVGSATTRVYNNTVVNNTIGIWVYDDARNAANLEGTQVGPDTKDVVLANNIISGGDTTSVKASRSNSTGTNTGPNTFFSGLDYDSYYRSQGAGRSLINWVDTSNAANYTSLATFHAAHGWEAHGNNITSGGDPFFVNQTAGNYAVRSTSVAHDSATSIPADIAALIGVSGASGGNRGALVYPGSGGATPPAPTATATAKPTASAVPTATSRPTATPTPRPTATPTARPTATPTARPTSTPTPAPVTAVFSAVNLPSNGRTVADAKASGGKALALWWTGSASGTVQMPTTTSIAIRARATSCDGAPTMDVSVDGKFVGSVDVSATSWESFRFATTRLAAGVHTITIAFPNDHYEPPRCDRNLFLDTVTLTG